MVFFVDNKTGKPKEEMKDFRLWITEAAGRIPWKGHYIKYDPN
jgi:hypothetical protein